MSASITQFLLEAKDCEWDKLDFGAQSEKLADLEKIYQFNFPEDYKEILMQSDGCTFYGPEDCLRFMNLRDVWIINDTPSYNTTLGDILIFGDDNGDLLYCFDYKNYLKQGTWAVFLISMSDNRYSHAKYLGENLREVLKKIIAGNIMYDSPYLKDI